MTRKHLLRGALLLGVFLLCGCSKKDAYDEAKSLMRDGKYKEAAGFFDEASANYNADAAFYVDMGFNYIELTKYTSAEESFKHAISIGESLKSAYRGLGITYYEEGKYTQAIEAFNKAIDLVELTVGEEEYDILKYRASCETKLNKLDNALKTYDALIGLGIDKVSQYLNEGNIYLKLKKNEKAKECFDAVLEIDDDNVEAYLTIYQNYLDANNREDGLKYLARALEVEGNSNEAHLWRGKIYYLMDNTAAALTELAYPLEAKNHEAALYTAFCYEAMGDYEKAIKLYYEELERQNDPAMINYLAICLTEKGDYNMAWNIVHSAISDYPDCECIQELCWNEIVLYEKMGYYPSAYTHLLEYQEKFPDDPDVEQELTFLLMKQS